MEQPIYEIPDSVLQLIQNGEREYRIIDYSPQKEMDNNQSMAYFLELIGCQQDNIVADYGTQVILCHLDYPQTMVVDAGGFGDFFSHGYSVKEYENL